MSHVRKASEAVSEGGSETESVIIFNENVFLAMQDAEISTTTYVKQAQQIIENLSTMPERWIKTPKSINNMAASKVFHGVPRSGHASLDSKLVVGGVNPRVVSVASQVEKATCVVFVLYLSGAARFHPYLHNRKVNTRIPAAENTTYLLCIRNSP